MAAVQTSQDINLCHLKDIHWVDLGFDLLQPTPSAAQNRTAPNTATTASVAMEGGMAQSSISAPALSIKIIPATGTDIVSDLESTSTVSGEHQSAITASATSSFQSATGAASTAETQPATTPATSGQHVYFARDLTRLGDRHRLLQRAIRQQQDTGREVRMVGVRYIDVDDKRLFFQTLRFANVSSSHQVMCISQSWDLDSFKASPFADHVFNVQGYTEDSIRQALAGDWWMYP